MAVSEANTYTDARMTEANTYAQNVANTAESNANHYTETKSAKTLSSANTYTDNKVSALSDSTNARFRQLGKRMDKIEKKLNAGVAGVTAIASIPYVAENNFSYGIGLGNYQNGNALAAGIQYKTSPNTNVRLNVSWDSSSNSAVGLGLAGGW